MLQILNSLKGNDKIKFQLKASGNSQRLFHGRGKLVSGLEYLCIDQFGKNILITTYAEITEEDKKALVDFLLSFSFPLDSILLQKRYAKNLEVEVLFGSIPEKANALEEGMVFAINLAKPQNIGFFLDMKVGRDYLRAHSKNKKVLNLFSYTCSLSVAALVGGASEVVNVDMAEPALSVGRLNHRLNSLEDKKVRYLDYNIMKSLGSIGKKGPFDLVIIDPPSFQGASFQLERDYPKIVKRLPEMLNEGATVLACVNDPLFSFSFLEKLFSDLYPELKLVSKMYSSFSEMDLNAEGGLKILELRLEK